jgi:hypothetical protein
MSTTTITANTAETAAITFAGGLVGYLASAGFAVTGAAVEHGALVGAIAALAVLGYHAYSGNAKTTA